jgi:hypothetical protein
MVQSFARRAVMAAAAVVALAACDQKISTDNHTYVTPAPNAQGTKKTMTRRELDAIPAASLAPIPAKLSCDEQEPVWVNTRRGIYHVAGDPFYGRTKRGTYMCKKDALRAGYRRAGNTQMHYAKPSSTGASRRMNSPKAALFASVDGMPE